MRFCPRCGVERVAKFCSGCGFDFDQNPEQQTKITEESPVSATKANSGEGTEAELVVDLDFNDNHDVPTERTDLSQQEIGAIETVDGAQEVELAATAEDSPQEKGRELPVNDEEFTGSALIETEAMTEPEVDLVTPSKPEGWYPDPINKTRFRYWDGTGWTDRTATKATGVQEEGEPEPANFDLAAPVVLEGLTYGKRYRSGASCFNCGYTPKETTNFCECCGATLKTSA
jgi:hypothetical protein